MSKNLIFAVPNTGRHNSCHINSCHMIFQYLGENIPLPKFIPLSTFTFGFLYLNDGKFILPAVSGCPCRDCMAFITEQLGYTYDIVSGESLEAVFPKIKGYIDNHIPMVAGPLPMELYRQHNPQAPLTGLDSFCVINGYDEENKKLFLTDTFGLGYMPVDFESIASGWKAGKRLCPKELIPDAPFLFVVKEKVKSYTELEVIGNALKHAYQLIKGRKISNSLLLGIEGQMQFCEDLKQGFNLPEDKLKVILSLIRDFVFLIGSQSRGDIAYFLRDYYNKISDMQRKKQILELAIIYEQEQFLYLDCLRISSLALKDAEEGREISSYFPIFHKTVNDVVHLEKEALTVLENF